MGFHEIHITQPAQLKYRDGNLLLRCSDLPQQLIPLIETNSIIVDNQQCILSQRFLVACQEYGINLVLTNSHHRPVSSTLRTKVEDQTNWSTLIKNSVWQKIVQLKLENQAMLLSHLKLQSFTLPSATTEITDSMEALAAKSYFHELFGDGFVRIHDSNDNINAMLNYGYMILVNYLTTQIKSHNYLPELGIHHRADENRQNLSCDFVEPFRFIVDQFVYQHKHDQFDTLIRSQLIDLLNVQITLNKKKYSALCDCLDVYVTTLLNALHTEDLTLSLGMKEDALDEIVGHV